MMVRRLSLLVLLFPVALAVSSPSSASARLDAEDNGTAERVSEELQDRQDRQFELVVRLEERYPEFFSKENERDSAPNSPSESSIRIASRVDGSDSLPSSPPTPAATSSSGSNPTPEKVVPYKPLVLGAFFVGTEPSPSSPSVEFPILPEIVRASPPPPLPRPKSNPAPAPSPSPVSTSTSSKSASSSSSPSTPSPAPVVRRSAGPADALLNFSDGPFPSSEDLVTGEPDAWYKSKVVSDLLGRTPNDLEQRSFENAVASKVEQSFWDSGLDIDLTTDLSDPAAHSLSVVSNALAKDNSAAIGIADIGGDGFTLIDNFETDSIKSIDDLETAVANNISHELMHAFGVDFHDESGETIDSGVIPWNLLISDELSFSDEAKNLLASAEFQSRWDDLLASDAQQIPGQAHGFGCSCHPAGAHTTPEPTTLVMWGLTLAGAIWSGQRWTRRRAA